MEEVCEYVPLFSNEWDNFLFFTCSASWLFVSFQGFEWLWDSLVNKHITNVIHAVIQERYKEFRLETKKDSRGCYYSQQIGYFVHELQRELLEYTHLEYEERNPDTNLYTPRAKLEIYYTNCVVGTSGLVLLEFYFRVSHVLHYWNLYALAPFVLLIGYSIYLRLLLRKKVREKYLPSVERFNILWDLYVYADENAALKATQRPKIGA